MTTHEVLRLALETLEDERYVSKYMRIVEVIAACKEALAAPQGEPFLHRLERKEGAAWIPATEWETGEPRSVWKELVLVHPDEWRIGTPINGKTFADALGKAIHLAPAPDLDSGLNATKTAPAPLTDWKLLAITTAYEQGVGKGMARDYFGPCDNPYEPESDEAKAWQLGYEEGVDKSPAPAPLTDEQKFDLKMKVLNWNRAQEKPPIEIAREMWVAEEIFALIERCMRGS